MRLGDAGSDEGQGGPLRLRRALVLAAALTLVSLLLAGPAGAQLLSFTDDFAGGYDRARWVKSDGYTNGSPFAVGWRADHVGFGNDAPESGVMSLLLDDVRSSGKRYSSGEYRTLEKAGYGSFRARIRAARGSGVVSSLFTYTGPAYGDPWDEIDLEFLGRDTTRLHLNYFTAGVGGHETVIDLGFDASLAYHEYGFDWAPGAITWFVDGKPVHTETGRRGPLPTHPGPIFMNLWVGDGTTTGWLGRFRYAGPIRASYSRVSYEAAGAAPAP